VTKINLDDAIFGKSPKRKPVSQSLKRKVYIGSEGKCSKCGDSLKGVTPHIHHKDGDPKNNALSNLKALCPNCHSKAHAKPIEKKSKGTDHDPLGLGWTKF
jgi:5-methylcytosine-specific restriction endonuclease McrA